MLGAGWTRRGRAGASASRGAIKVGHCVLVPDVGAVGLPRGGTGRCWGALVQLCFPCAPRAHPSLVRWVLAQPPPLPPSQRLLHPRHLCTDTHPWPHRKPSAPPSSRSHSPLHTCPDPFPHPFAHSLPRIPPMHTHRTAPSTPPTSLHTRLHAHAPLHMGTLPHPPPPCTHAHTPPPRLVHPPPCAHAQSGAGDANRCLWTPPAGLAGRGAGRLVPRSIERPGQGGGTERWGGTRGASGDRGTGGGTRGASGGPGGGGLGRGVQERGRGRGVQGQRGRVGGVWGGDGDGGGRDGVMG